MVWSGPCFLVSAVENVAWTLNLRGTDADYSPLPNCYLIIDNKGKANFFCDLRKINKKLKLKLKNIKIIDIKYIENFLNKIKNKIIQIDNLTCSILFRNILINNNKVLNFKDPVYLLKAIKNY